MEELRKKDEIVSELEIQNSNLETSNQNLEQMLRNITPAQESYQVKTQSPKRDEMISMLTLQNQSSLEQTEILRAQNEGLKDLLSQKDLKMLKLEKDKKFMEIQMEEYERQVNSVIMKYDNVLLDNNEKCQEIK